MLAAGFDETPDSWLRNGRSWSSCTCGQLADESAQCARNCMTTTIGLALAFAGMWVECLFTVSARALTTADRLCVYDGKPLQMCRDRGAQARKESVSGHSPRHYECVNHASLPQAFTSRCRVPAAVGCPELADEGGF